MPEPFWSAPIERVLAGLGARPDGLTQPEADARLLAVGGNRRSTTRTTSPLRLLLNQFRQSEIENVGIAVRVDQISGVKIVVAGVFR